MDRLFRVAHPLFRCTPVLLAALLACLANAASARPAAGATGSPEPTSAAGSLSQAAGPAPSAGGSPRETWRAYEGAPAGGFPYRLTIGSDATAERPHRLVVWLHPGGHAVNYLPESLLPTFVRRGFALLVITGKQFSGWTDHEAEILLTRVLPDAAKAPGLDPNRPVLFGFSAGGQLAMALWREQPSRFGGIIIDAAYPLEEKDGRQVLMDLPSDADFKKVPLLVGVGADDPVAESWSKVEDAWKAAGVPLTLRWVAGLKHEWVFRGAEAVALEEWLESLAAPAQIVAPPQEEPAPAVQP